MIENKLDLTYYSGVDLYSDGEIEDRLLRIVEEEDDMTNVLKQSDEWPLLYHLSNIRENLLDWYPFDPEGTVLEIGAGCGAITGLLCRKTKNVVGIELSKKRSTINATRNKDYNNLKIMVGNFEDIVIEEKFDYVTLIGVFEYAICYVNDKKPFEAMLEKAKSYLKPNGTLIIAIENKYGMKYFAGATEDHTGLMFDGIQNYYKVNRVRTFSKSRLEQLLTGAGFEKQEFYYPLPDYKLPTTIYSDDFLPKAGDLRNMANSYDRNRYELFDEDLAFDAVCQDDLFKEFSNSYLVFSSLKENNSEDR